MLALSSCLEAQPFAEAPYPVLACPGIGHREGEEQKEPNSMGGGEAVLVKALFVVEGLW